MTEQINKAGLIIGILGLFIPLLGIAAIIIGALGYQKNQKHSLTVIILGVIGLVSAWLVDIILLAIVTGTLLQSTGTLKEGIMPTAELTINFGLPNMVDQQSIRITENMTALELLSNYANYVSVDAGNVKCIGSYCSTNRSAWKFYANDAIPIESPDDYIVHAGDTILFSYEERS